jgi:hypothetical protein
MPGFQNGGRGVAHRQKGGAGLAGLDVAAILAAAIGGAGRARGQRQRTVHDAQDIGEADLVAGPSQSVAATRTPQADEQAGLFQLGQNRFEELARNLLFGRDDGGRYGRGPWRDVPQGADGVAGALRDHGMSIARRARPGNPVLPGGDNGWAHEKGARRCRAPR